MSKTKLKNAFKLKYNMTITEYTQRRRMSMAEQLLETPHLSIKDVALTVGYQSHSRFSSLFKKYMGIYPYEIRNRHHPTNEKSCAQCQHMLCIHKTE